MNKILMLAFANIRKTKGNTVSLIFMFLIAALLLNAGLLVFVNFGGFFDKTTKELNTSNIFYILPSHLYNNNVEAYLRNNDNILEMQKEESLYAKVVINFDNNTRGQVFLFSDADKSRNISKWKFTGAHLL